MRLPSYRKHSSGQARVTINGKDYMLGEFGSQESKQAYATLLNEYTAAGKSSTFGKTGLLVEDVILAYISHAKTYYSQSREYDHFCLAVKPFVELYASLPADQFGPAEFKALRAWWVSDPKRSRQYVNAQMRRAVRVLKWLVGEGQFPADKFTAIQCVAPLKRGRVVMREAPPVPPVARATVDATLPHLTPVVADTVRRCQ